MANRKFRNIARNVLTVSMVLVLVISLCSCSEAVRALRIAFGDEDVDFDDPDNGSVRRRNDPTDATYETLEPTGTYSTEIVEPVDYDIDYIRSVCIYSVWYDAVDDNPVNVQYVNKEDAFAIKGVFYFSVPLTTVFEARLYQDGNLILTKELVLSNNISAEADFSAGLEGWGTFDSGTYSIELLFEGETVAVTDDFFVEE